MHECNAGQTKLQRLRVQCSVKVAVQQQVLVHFVLSRFVTSTVYVKGHKKVVYVVITHMLRTASGPELSLTTHLNAYNKEAWLQTELQP